MFDLIHVPIVPFFLYAETHYKFKGIYSRLFKKQPEIIADAPLRVEPGQAIPILILVKDAHRFPIEILEVIIEIKQFGRLLTKHSFVLNLLVDRDPFWQRIFYLERPAEASGLVAIDVQIVIKWHGKICIYHNDNYRISSHLPLEVFLSDHDWPKFDNWYFGDFHYHSNYTEDQVEFGAPLSATVAMARALGLDFVAVTDHSYDLDDHEGLWVRNDPALNKWRKFRAEVEAFNSNREEIVVLPGEEVSVGNSRHRNIHLLVIDHPEFLPGQGDSAERWFHTWPDLPLTTILERLHPQALAIAGHPEMATPFLQWLLIRRGDWEVSDLGLSRLDGFQIWNGEFDRSFHHGSAKWVKLLLAGSRLSLIAGNDAHGNFNRFRQIGFPFFTFREGNFQRFGMMRTGVCIEGDANRSSIIQAVKSHRTLVTSGPIIDMMVHNTQNDKATIGSEISGEELLLHVRAKSTPEFGRLKSLKIYRGDLVEKKEKLEIQCQNFLNSYSLQWEQRIIESSNSSYLRAELVTQTNAGAEHRCLTSPIWISN
ncbi:MAG: CehA/McbA family metallohydrolase [candidate division KSB1 bacterium]|nr:CehA/McbA family metallohydrolase [candidate division KSB1 bacterium]MDZ7335825.1 CehA/McbA family metallohydrolase [candidate division KSB1 bacterium]MDZ7356180.1 CehA/McbA family metallohydrolase [candidate division KSB1 bacterium]MDZ7376801.1 CehA/McbA family metallohydrolase [candidate division KSB1 bacterium]MDZ7400323.1 CehA/McbA family metallohydrolase [candidate division KSB1 bacterium]